MSSVRHPKWFDGTWLYLFEQVDTDPPDSWGYVRGQWMMADYTIDLMLGNRGRMLFGRDWWRMTL
jgi:hypothetical protein